MPSGNKQTTITPIDGSAVKTVDLPTDEEVNEAVTRAVAASKSWRKTSIQERLSIMSKFLDAMEAEKQEIGGELTLEMGRPIASSAGEVNGFLERGRHLVSIAEKSLADVPIQNDKTFKKYLRKEALGVVFVIAPWNFPYLCQANIVIPSILSGNAVLVKPSPQTPSTSERIVRLLEASGLPKDVAQCLHLAPEQIDMIVGDFRVNSVNFTGSVANGIRVEQAVAQSAGKGRFKRVGLELGGKDAAYVRKDVDVAWAAEQVVDGAFYNSGQSCCAIERVYVHRSIHDQFVQEVKKHVEAFKLGDPRDKSTTLGPVISVNAARNVRKHYADAVTKGGKPLVDEAPFASVAKDNTAYVNPQVFTDVDHSMQIMTEETFGPCVGVMAVDSDEQAVELINDSIYGLTCSVWTNDEDAFESLAPLIEAGTVYQNRCDYCDPSLAWTGVKNSGRGTTLSAYVFDTVTQLKSVHIKRVQ